jgi:5-carboxymethyl-2-hydroxymuconate isomerase
MPHLVLLYSADVDRDVDIGSLCRALADTMIDVRDEQGKPVFPTGGTRVLGYPAAHAAVADGRGNYGFLYANLRMATGRSPAVHQAVGAALLDVLKTWMDPLLAQRPVGVTLQIDESGGQVFDAKHSSLHPLFNRS